MDVWALRLDEAKPRSFVDLRRSLLEFRVLGFTVKVLGCFRVEVWWFKTQISRVVFRVCGQELRGLQSWTPLVPAESLAAPALPKRKKMPRVSNIPQIQPYTVT